jgi:DNA end-binding protein Ku
MDEEPMAPRANWKGTLKIAEVTCPVALFTAASTSDRIAFHTLNRATGNRVRREYIDSDTGKPVEREDQVKGYELNQGDFVVLQPDEIAAAVPESDKTLDVKAFVACEDIDDVYFDKPYYLAPAGKSAAEAFVLIREGLEKAGVAAIAQTVLFRRVRSVLIRAQADGLSATTLNFDHEVRSAEDAFKAIPDTKIEGEMLDLAKHIIRTKLGQFQINTFDDRYEAALAELVKAKAEGRRIAPRAAAKDEKVVDLLAALRESAGLAGKAAKAPKDKPPKRKAG